MKVRTLFVAAAAFGASTTAQSTSPYGVFPQPNDTLRLQPCLGIGAIQKIPALNDTTAEQTWAAHFNPDPGSWKWGSSVTDTTDRGIFLCAYLDVSLDYTTKSDSRIARLAAVKTRCQGSR